MLRSSGFAAGGIGLFLIGCSGDDDGTATTEAVADPTAEATDDPTAGATETATAAPTEAAGEGGLPSKIVIQSVTLTGDDGTVVLRNLSAAAITIDGWFICQRPNYWPIPATTIEPGGELTLHVAVGTDDDTNFFASGGFASLAGRSGEIALYDSSNFGSADSIVAYVSWNGSSGRKSTAQEAGVWGADDLAASDGDTLVFVGPSEDASGYALQ